MAKYTEAQLVAMGVPTFEKKVRCFLLEEDGRKDVIYVADDGTTLSDHLTLKDEDGVVYALPTTSRFGSWWKKD